MIKAPDRVQAAIYDLYIRRGGYNGSLEPFEDAVDMAYRAGARHALLRTGNIPGLRAHESESDILRLVAEYDEEVQF